MKLSGSRKQQTKGRQGASARLADKAIRPGAVLILIGLLFAISIPLYVWRGPERKEIEIPLSPPEGVPPSTLATPQDSDARLVTGAQFGPVRVRRCGTLLKSMKLDGARCDRQPFLERALVRTIADYDDCHPLESGRSEFRLLVDFRTQRLDVVARNPTDGMSAAAARRTARCVRSSLPTIPWSELEHEHRAYQIGVSATFPKRLAPAIPTYDRQ